MKPAPQSIKADMPTDAEIDIAMGRVYILPLEPGPQTEGARNRLATLIAYRRKLRRLGDEDGVVRDMLETPVEAYPNLAETSAAIMARLIDTVMES